MSNTTLNSAPAPAQPSLYDSMLHAQLDFFPMPTNNTSQTNTKPSQTQELDATYLTWLKSTTAAAWPDIKESHDAEQRYYRMSQFDNGWGGFLENTTAAPTLSQIYGPLHAHFHTLHLEGNTWVRFYRSCYAYFPGTDGDLLRLIAEAYAETRKELLDPEYERLKAAKKVAAMKSSAVSGKHKQYHDDRDWDARYDDP